MAGRPIKDPEATPAMYTVEFTKQRLGFRVLPCSEHETKLRTGLISDQSMAEELTEGDEIWALNGYTMEELGVKTHQEFAKHVVKIPERPLFITFISEADLKKSVLDHVGDALGGVNAGALAMFSGNEADLTGEDDDEEVVKVTSVSFSEGVVGGKEPLSPRSSMRQDYEVKEANEWDPDVNDLFGFQGGYHPFSLKYTKIMKLDPANPTMDKIEKQYLDFGKKVWVKSDSEKGLLGVVVNHHKNMKRGGKEWDKKGDTFDVKLYDGHTYKNVVPEDLTPIEIIYIPLACGLSLEDFCLYGACLGCVWSTLCAAFGMLLFAHEETGDEQTALTTFFYLGIFFAVALVLIVYIGRTLALIQTDEEEAEEKRSGDGADEFIDDEEVGLIGHGHYEE